MKSLDLSKRFDGTFFTKPTLLVARKLIGAILVHNSARGICAGRIVETEAYLGPEDKAAHTFGGHRSLRNEAMWGDRGRAYIFQVYGMYYCLNCVSGPVGQPQAVLIRALEAVTGTEIMLENLGVTAAAPLNSLCRGPGKLCKAMGITKALYGEDLRGDTLFLVPGKPLARERIGESVRINIDYAEEYIHHPWRFYERGNAAVSGCAALRK